MLVRFLDFLLRNRRGKTWGKAGSGKCGGVRLVGAKHCPCGLQLALNVHCGRMRATKHAPRDPSRVLARRHCLAAIFERGTRVDVERLRVIPPHSDCVLIIISKNASRHGYHFEQKWFGFFEAS